MQGNNSCSDDANGLQEHSIMAICVVGIAGCFVLVLVALVLWSAFAQRMVHYPSESDYLSVIERGLRTYLLDTDGYLPQKPLREALYPDYIAHIRGINEGLGKTASGDAYALVPEVMGKHLSSLEIGQPVVRQYGILPPGREERAKRLGVEATIVNHGKFVSITLMHLDRETEVKPGD